MKVRAEDIRPGQLVDLEGDKYADPDNDSPIFDCEYAVVQETEDETEDCVCIYFDSFTCGFPKDHLLEVYSVPKLMEGKSGK